MKKILLVDDSRTTLFVEELLLAPRFALAKAKDGHDALCRIREEKPDLVLLDLVMPRLDGYEVLRRLRQDAATATLPVILVTGRGEEGNLERAFGLGCNDYVNKPIDGDELLAKIGNCLDEAAVGP